MPTLWHTSTNAQEALVALQRFERLLLDRGPAAWRLVLTVADARLELQDGPVEPEFPTGLIGLWSFGPRASLELIPAGPLWRAVISGAVEPADLGLDPASHPIAGLEAEEWAAEYLLLGGRAPGDPPDQFVDTRIPRHLHYPTPAGSEQGTRPVLSVAEYRDAGILLYVGYREVRVV